MTVGIILVLWAIATWVWSNIVFNFTTWWTWPIIAMAAYRWAAFLVLEEGPWGVFMWLRRKRGVFQMTNGAGIAPSFTAFVCIRCMSVWTVVWLLCLPWQFSLVFALSAAAIMVARIL